MRPTGLWARIRQARLFRVFVVYLAASWLVLQVAGLLQDKLQLPPWITPAVVILLLAGLVVILATAWVQAHPPAKVREGELPSPWEVDVKGLVSSLTTGRVPHLTWARAILGGLVAFSLLFGASGIYLYLKGRGAGVSMVREATAAPGPGIAVLPFRVVGPGLELWREGMVDLLSTNLDGVAGLRKIDPRAVLSRWRGEIGEGKDAPDLQAALGIARGLEASYALVGSAVALGTGVRLTGEVHDLATGALRGTAVVVEGEPDSVFTLVNRLSVDVLRTILAGKSSTLPEVDLTRVTTSSLPALKAYLAGEQHYRRNRFREAIVEFRRALDADSTFALALYRLSTGYGWTEGIIAPARIEYADRAARLAERLPEREALLLRGNEEFGDGRLSALETLEVLTTRYPDDVEGWYALGDAYQHVGPKALQPSDKFRAALRRAIELDPSLGPAYIHLIEDAFPQGDSAEARRLIDRYQQLDPGSPHGIGLDLAYALVWGDSAPRSRARAALDTAQADVLRAAEEVFAGEADFWDKQIEVTRAASGERHPLFSRRIAQLRMYAAYFFRGRLREARQALAALLEDESWIRAASRSYLAAHVFDDRYADTVWARRAPRTLASNPEPADHFLLGALAAAEKRWDDVEKEIAGLESRAEERARQQDSLGVMERIAYARALRGYAALRRGDREAALREIEAALPEIPGAAGVPVVIHSFLRHEMGKLWLEAGDLQKAERYFKSVDYYPPAQFYLGEVYEALGDTERAKLHYARFVRFWEDCDPELRPMWEQGRQALARLTREAATPTAAGR